MTSSHALTNGVDMSSHAYVPYANGDVGQDSDGDPEKEAEQEYAREHGEVPNDSTMAAAAAKQSSSPLKDASHMKEKLAHRLKAFRETAPPPVMNGVVTAGRDIKNQRKSRAGRGRAGMKKDGGGGKFTWGIANQLYEDLDLDPNDPNYDSEANVTFDEVTVEVTADVAVKYVTPIILEFYANGDIREALDSLQEMGLSREARYVVVRVLISLALDHKNDARELANELLAELVHRRIFTSADTAKAFTALVLEDLCDLSIDYPDACILLGNFIARAIADLVLPTDFIDTLKAANNNDVPSVTKTLERAATLIKHQHQLHDIWGVGGGRKPVRQLSHQMHTILQEYLLNCDDEEVSRCLRELEVPHFHHELVYQAGVLAIESMHERPIRLLALLISKMATSGELSSTAIEKGFDRLYVALPDLSIDLPPAFSLAEWWTKAALDAGFIGKAIADRLPRKGRKRIVSEGHDGRLMVSDVANPYV